MGRNRPKGGLLGGFDQLRAPDAPTISVTAGNEQVSVAFTNPSDVGGGAISSYTATAIASGVPTGATSTTSPVTITGLTNGTSYSVTGLANNAFGASPYSSATSASPVNAADRAIFVGGNDGSNINTMEFVQISTLGNTSDFGDYGGTIAHAASMASSTLGVIGGGDYNGSQTNIMEFVTIATEGNSSDFGDLTAVRSRMGGSNGVASSVARGFFTGGLNSSSNGTQDKMLVLITSGGYNATTFNYLQLSRYDHVDVASETRCITMGGTNYNSSAHLNSIEYSTFASNSGGTDFGDLTETVGGSPAGASSGTRGVRAGGQTSGGKTETMDYITIASTGNATDFGDLAAATNYIAGTSNATRGVFGGGDTGSKINTIQYITIASTGNTSDFGDLSASKKFVTAFSGSHGGLQ